jgi:hypothetical protein
MKNNKLTIGAAALTAVIVTAGFAASSFAYQGDPTVQGPNSTPERHEAMTVAFETGDYDAWVAAKGDVAKGRIMNVINEDNFSKFIEIRELRLAGDIEGANEIRAELGLGQGEMKRGGGEGSRGQGSKKGMNRTGERGQNANNNFVDANGDGTCDNLQ